MRPGAVRTHKGNKVPVLSDDLEIRKVCNVGDGNDDYTLLGMLPAEYRTAIPTEAQSILPMQNPAPPHPNLLTGETHGMQAMRNAYASSSHPAVTGHSDLQQVGAMRKRRLEVGIAMAWLGSLPSW